MDRAPKRSGNWRSRPYPYSKPTPFPQPAPPLTPAAPLEEIVVNGSLYRLVKVESATTVPAVPSQTGNASTLMKKCRVCGLEKSSKKMGQHMHRVHAAKSGGLECPKCGYFEFLFDKCRFVGHLKKCGVYAQIAACKVTLSVPVVETLLCQLCDWRGGRNESLSQHMRSHLESQVVQKSLEVQPAFANLGRGDGPSDPQLPTWEEVCLRLQTPAADTVDLTGEETIDLTLEEEEALLASPPPSPPRPSLDERIRQILGEKCSPEKAADVKESLKLMESLDLPQELLAPQVQVNRKSPTLPEGTQTVQLSVGVGGGLVDGQGDCVKCLTTATGTPIVFKC